MYSFLVVFLPILGVNSASYYPRYGDTSGYPSSTMTNLNNYNLNQGSHGSDIASFPEVTRYPNYSPSYGYGSSSGYSSYTTKYPFSSGISTTYNSLYNGVSSNYNQGLNRYGAGYGTGYGSGSYSTGYGSNNYGSGSYGSSYGSNGYGSSGYGSSGYGSNGYGSNGYGSSSYGSGGYGSSNGLRGYGAGTYGTGSTVGGYSPYEVPFMTNLGSCVNRSPQNGIWVDSLMGMWYGVEYIQHLGADSHIDYDTRTCIVIHIAEPRDRPSTEHQVFHVQHINAKFRQDYRHLRLLWDEAGHTAEYALFFRNDTAGYWHVYDGQNGTMSRMPSYQQFGGTIQVLKAVNDHLVLNFCQEGINGRSPQLYSVLFSRVPGELSRWEIDSVHSLLQNKKLSTASRRMVCGNGADRLVFSLAVPSLMCLVAFMIGSS